MQFFALIIIMKILGPQGRVLTSGFISFVWHAFKMTCGCHIVLTDKCILHNPGPKKLNPEGQNACSEICIRDVMHATCLLHIFHTDHKMCAYYFTLCGFCVNLFKQQMLNQSWDHITSDAAKCKRVQIFSKG